MDHSVQSWIRRLGGSLFGLGYIPLAPGTLGSIAAAGGAWYVNSRWPELFSLSMAPTYWVGMLGLIALSIYLGSDGQRVFGREDPPQMIFDEVVGQLMVWFLVPLNMRTLLLGVLLFRFFDIVKPFPVHNMEDIEGGVGVTMDDVAAGMYANLTLVGILALYQAVKVHL